jgi:hypothetical protein
MNTKKINPVDQAPTSSTTESNDQFAQALSDMTSESTVGTGSAVAQEIMNSYVTSKNNGVYTPEFAEALGGSLAPMLTTELSYHSYTSSDITTTADTSEKVSVAYQQSLRDALAPLRTNTTPEFEFFGMYLQTKDPQYLTKLQSVATLYQDAAANAGILVVPKDIAQYHVAVLNSLNEFAAVLNALSAHANDPIESTMLLRNYNSSEQNVLSSFNAIHTYYANKYAKHS